MMQSSKFAKSNNNNPFNTKKQMFVISKNTTSLNNSKDKK